MPLPKVSYPTGSVILPTAIPKKTVKYRTFTAREEKLLLMAKHSRTDQDILQAIKQIVQNCVMDHGFDVNHMATVDVEYLFIRLRILSVSGTVSMQYLDESDNKHYPVEIDLEKVKVVGGTEKRTIKVDDRLAFSMRYPVAAIWDDAPIFEEDEPTAFARMVARSLDKIYDGETVMEAPTYSVPELVEFVESLPMKVYDEVKAFFLDLPHLDYTVEYKTKAGEERKIQLRTLNDFFTFV